MKKSVKVGALAICVAIVSMFVACTTETVYKPNIIPDPNPYSFNNVDNHPHAEYDSYMKIDGKLDEDKYKNVEWLYGEDKPNSVQNATIEITSFIGEKGVFVGAKVEETGSNIWVNPERGSWTNSCLELYIGPIGQQKENCLVFEFDLQADGTTGNMRLAPKQPNEMDIHTTWDKMPIIAAQQIGGKVNTPECTGYTVECFYPWAYFEMGGWDVSDKQNFKVGIDPVHIFSLKYDGEEVGQNVTNTRIWSRWSEKVLPSIGWLNPDTYFRFDKNGLMKYNFTVNKSGDGNGSIITKNGEEFIYGWGTSTFIVKPRNGATVKKIQVNGQDYMSKLKDNNGSYEFDVKDPMGDLTIDVEFGF